MKALIIANGRAPERDGLPAGTLSGAALVIAADGGAATAERLGLLPDLVMGDLDSVTADVLARAVASGAAIRRVPAEKDESDLELALGEALTRGADRIVILGALGGERVEHVVASLALLDIPRGEQVDLAIVDERSTIRLLVAGERSGPTARLEIEGEPGDWVSLQPWGGDVVGVTTENLRYPLSDEPLRMGPARGLSNELTAPCGWISCREGRLLVIHTRRAAVETACADPEVSS
jgi:thiamine pyrophosphokinase